MAAFVRENERQEIVRRNARSSALLHPFPCHSARLEPFAPAIRAIRAGVQAAGDDALANGALRIDSTRLMALVKASVAPNLVWRNSKAEVLEPAVARVLLVFRTANVFAVRRTEIAAISAMGKD